MLALLSFDEPGVSWTGLRQRYGQGVGKRKLSKWGQSKSLEPNTPAVGLGKPIEEKKSAS